MHSKRLMIPALLLSGLCLAEVHAQTMNVLEKNNALTAYSISKIRKMTFSSGNLTVTDTDNSSATYAFSSLRYLNFSNIIASVASDDLTNSGLHTYPNPVSDVLNIYTDNRLSEGATIELITLEGSVVKTHRAESSDSIAVDLSDIAAGIYVCRLSSNSEIRTVKIIKQ